MYTTGLFTTTPRCTCYYRIIKIPHISNECFTKPQSSLLSFSPQPPGRMKKGVSLKNSYETNLFVYGGLLLLHSSPVLDALYIGTYLCIHMYTLPAKYESFKELLMFCSTTPYAYAP